MNKKGLSPLIATVLLIAFAVALGAMIMNWSTSMSAPEPTGGSSNPCRDVRIEIKPVFGKDLFCYRDEQIVFSIINSGTREIKGIQLITVDEDLLTQKQEMPSSSMPIGESFDGSYPFTKSGKVHVEIVPKVFVDNEPVYCQERKIVQDILADCE